MAKYQLNVFLGCGHINTIYIEAAPFAPSVGSQITCNICKSNTVIKKRSEPAYMGPTAPNQTIKEQNKNRE